jgi:hypothetical protein
MIRNSRHQGRSCWVGGFAANAYNKKGSGAIPLGEPSWSDDPDSIGSRVKIAGGGEHAEYLINATHAALDAIHAVHGDGGMPDVSVKVNPRLKGELSKYHGITGERVGHCVELKPGSQHPAFTMVHELGHFLDQWEFDTDGFAEASENGGSPMAKPIMDTLYASLEVRSLLKDQKRARSVTARNHLNYLAEATEILARAYSQYIAQKSGHPALMAGLEVVRRGTFGGPPGQWSDESFKPIAQAFDRWLDAKDWSKRT